MGGHGRLWQRPWHGKERQAAMAHGEGWAHGKVAQYLPRRRSMATAPMAVNADHSTNASNGLPARDQYIKRYSSMTMAARLWYVRRQQRR